MHKQKYDKIAKKVQDKKFNTFSNPSPQD